MPNLHQILFGRPTAAQKPWSASSETLVDNATLGRDRALALGGIDVAGNLRENLALARTRHGLSAAPLYLNAGIQALLDTGMALGFGGGASPILGSHTPSLRVPSRPLSPHETARLQDLSKLDFAARTFMPSFPQPSQPPGTAPLRLPMRAGAQDWTQHYRPAILPETGQPSVGARGDDHIEVVEQNFWADHPRGTPFKDTGYIGHDGKFYTGSRNWPQDPTTGTPWDQSSQPDIGGIPTTQQMRIDLAKAAPRAPGTSFADYAKSDPEPGAPITYPPAIQSKLQELGLFDLLNDPSVPWGGAPNRIATHALMSHLLGPEDLFRLEAAARAGGPTGTHNYQFEAQRTANGLMNERVGAPVPHGWNPELNALHAQLRTQIPGAGKGPFGFAMHMASQGGLSEEQQALIPSPSTPQFGLLHGTDPEIPTDPTKLGGITDIHAFRSQLARLAGYYPDAPLLPGLTAPIYPSPRAAIAAPLLARNAARQPARNTLAPPNPGFLLSDELHTAIQDPIPSTVSTFGGLPRAGAGLPFPTQLGPLLDAPPDYPAPLSYNQRRRRANAALPASSQRPVWPPQPPPGQAVSSLAAHNAPNAEGTILPYAGPPSTDMPLPDHPEIQAYLEAHPENRAFVQQHWNAIMGVPNPNFHGLDAPTDLPHSSRLPGMRTVSELPSSILDPYDLREESLPPKPWDSESQNLWSVPPSAWTKHPFLPSEPAPGAPPWAKHTPWFLDPSQARLSPPAPPDPRSPHRSRGEGLDFPTSLENSLFSMNSLFPDFKNSSGQTRMTTDAAAAAYPVPWIQKDDGGRFNPNARPPASHTDYTEGPLLPNQVQTIRTNPSDPTDISPAVHTLKSQKLSDDSHILSIKHPAVRGHNLAPFDETLRRKDAAQLQKWMTERVSTGPVPPLFAKVLRNSGNSTYRQLYTALERSSPGLGKKVFKNLGYTGTYYQDLSKDRDPYQYQPPTGQTLARLWDAPAPPSAPRPTPAQDKARDEQDNRNAAAAHELNHPALSPIKLQGSSPHLAKDQLKADQATHFIGRGSPSSSTSGYARSFGQRANPGTYTSEHTVFISAEGARPGALEPDYAEIQRAITARATLITDRQEHRSRPYNTGERKVAKYLATHGYYEASPGRWLPDLPK